MAGEQDKAAGSGEPATNDVVQETPKPSEPTPPAADPDPEPQPDDVSGRTRDYANYGIIYIDQTSHGGDRRRRVSARAIGASELHDELTHFAAPPRFVDASDLLHRHRLVILGGKAGTGRRCAALALLTRSAPLDVDCRTPIIELNPSTTMDELATLSFEPGQRYLLAGQTADRGHAEQIGFELKTLCDRLAAGGALLVTTTDRPASMFLNRAVDWDPVDCRAILDGYLRYCGSEYDEESRTLLRNVAELRRPAEMREFFTLLEQAGPTELERHFESENQVTVRGLISTAPDTPIVLPLLAGAFLPSSRQRSYEAHLDRLDELVDRHSRRSPWTRDYDRRLEQTRKARATWVVTTIHPTEPQERNVALAGTVDRIFLLRQLRQHYGRELWAAVHTWLLERPGKIDDVQDERALARGMALFARVDPAGAYAVLDTWADEKPLGWRWAAAASVSAMCEDELTAPAALRIARRWARGSPRMKIAATMAFGQALGQQHPTEAMSYLWFLSLGDVVVGRTARHQLTAFVQVTYQNATLLRYAISTVHWQLEQVLHDETSTERRKGRAIETVSSIISAEVADGVSLTLHVLRRFPDGIAPLGQLWAEVLRSWPHRTAGLDTLQDAHDALEPAEQASAFANLGMAVRRHLGPLEWQWVRRDLGASTWFAISDGDSEVAV